ncbi:MAG: TatD family hydrolase [Synergistes sp.]|nr:TatD family hydrolase [Synergistes sp.]
MYYFDAHLHLTDVTHENLKEMAMCGIRGIVSPVQLAGAKANHPETIIDMWDFQLEKQLGRAKAFMIDAYAMIGISMVATPKDSLEKLIALQPEYLAKPKVVAIGEVGFEPGSKTNNDLNYQQTLLEMQIENAIKTNCRIDIHLPNVPDKKVQFTEKCIELFKSHGMDMKKVIFDHCSDANIEIVLAAGAYAAISVQPWRKITPEIAAGWVIKYDSDYVLVDSDSSSLPSDCLAVAKTAFALEQAGAPKSLIERACSLNCRTAYGID